MFLDDVGKFFSGDWSNVGLDASNDGTKIFLPGVPVQPSSSMSDDEIRAWRLQNTNLFANGGLLVTADGDLKKLTGYDPTKAPGAIIPDSSFGAALKDTLGFSTPNSYNGSGGAALTTIAIGVGVLLALLIVVEVVKK